MASRGAVDTSFGLCPPAVQSLMQPGTLQRGDVLEGKFAEHFRRAGEQFDLPCTRGAVAQVRFDRRPAGGIQLAIEVRAQKLFITLGHDYDSILYSR